MPSIARRAFLGWLAGLASATTLARRAGATLIAPRAAPAPRPALLHALGEAVLPMELGRDGVARAAAAFDRWVREYRAGAEVMHGYGDPRITYLGPSPAARWWPQLDELDAEAVRRHGRAFPALSVAERRALVRARIAASGTVPDALPSLLAARDVTVAMLAHFLASPEATDLCYRARIGKNACRPLAASPRRPDPLPPRG